MSDPPIDPRIFAPIDARPCEPVRAESSDLGKWVAFVEAALSGMVINFDGLVRAVSRQIDTQQSIIDRLKALEASLAAQDDGESWKRGEVPPHLGGVSDDD